VIFGATWGVHEVGFHGKERKDIPTLSPYWQKAVWKRKERVGHEGTLGGVGGGG